MALFVENGHLHAGARVAAGTDLGLGAIVGIMTVGGQHRDVAGDLAKAVILHQHLAQCAQRMALVRAVHGGACVDDVAQAAVIVTADGRVFGEHLDDGRYREQVVDTVLLHQAPGLVAVQPVPDREHASSTPGYVDQGMNTGPVGQGGQYQRT